MEPSSYVFPYLRTQLQQIAASVATESCAAAAEEEAECRDEAAALRLKMVAVASILVAGAAGVAIPLIGRWWRRGTSSSSSPSSSSGVAFTLAKAFAAGVILATGFVHMLNDANEALTDPCLPESPWRHFPFPGFIAMLAALGTLVADFVTTSLYEKTDQAAAAATSVGDDQDTAPLLEAGSLAGITSVVGSEASYAAGDKDPMHIVGMRAHSQLHGHGSYHETGSVYDDGHAHGHSHGFDEEPSGGRHVAAAQILELGIVSHSVIIGLSLGVSQSPCTIRPLVAALSFHQFFEGFALGGCISQAQFKSFSALMMAFFFAITTPAGITVGACIASFYNPNSPRALVVEGILDSMSAGILIYMALVDLIAADFLSKRMRSNPRLQAGSYVALFLGAMAMASLAIWA
ncbi:hypothetical protein QOZ80_6BG0496410 [Eleusine coracana subsp. coracana]|nr:hypothetical protein QOZ80_6BG0496410 [Eleusine coracana subsp. coracana]